MDATRAVSTDAANTLAGGGAMAAARARGERGRRHCCAGRGLAGRRCRVDAGGSWMRHTRCRPALQTPQLEKVPWQRRERAQGTRAAVLLYAMPDIPRVGRRCDCMVRCGRLVVSCRCRWGVDAARAASADTSTANTSAGGGATAVARARGGNEGGGAAVRDARRSTGGQPVRPPGVVWQASGAVSTQMGRWM